VVKIWYIDPTSVPDSMLDDEPAEPLWRRDMPGLKHIRGILYEDSEHVPATSLFSVPKAKSVAPKAGKEDNVSKTIDDVLAGGSSLATKVIIVHYQCFMFILAHSPLIIRCF
jgi:hypothetical protein